MVSMGITATDVNLRYLLHLRTADLEQPSASIYNLTPPCAQSLQWHSQTYW